VSQQPIPERARASCWLVAVAIASSLAAVRCGPSVATPMPEPPSIDGRKIAPTPDVITGLAEPHALALTGDPGAVTPGSLVRVTNLDDTGAAVTAQADADGGFELSVFVRNGDELRFQAVEDDRRSVPVDLVYTQVELADELTPSPRHPCVVLQPGLELRYDDVGPSPLRVLNDCAEPLALTDPRLRLDTGEFQLEGQLPLVIPPASEATLDVTLLEPSPPAREDVLFLDLSLGAETIRYPIGLFAPALDPGN
jgi:hypothetical protein